jgi:arsenate reductase
LARVLFVCLRTAGRSQMSEMLFTRAARGRHEARSAGTRPADRVHTEAAEVMGELGAELGARKPRRLTETDAQWADVFVTMGCGDDCPYLPGTRARRAPALRIAATFIPVLSGGGAGQPKQAADVS